jgi:hypothetical protein
MIWGCILTEISRTADNVLVLVCSATNSLNVPAMIMGNIATIPTLAVRMADRVCTDRIGTMGVLS